MERRDDRGPDGLDTFVEEARPPEAGVAIASLRVEDPEVGPPPRRPVAAPLDRHLHPLPDDVPSQPDPAAAGEPQAKARRLVDRTADRGREAGRAEDDETRSVPPGERAEAVEAVRESRWSSRRSNALAASGARSALRARERSVGQIEDEQVYGPTLEERATHPKALLDRRRGQDDEPFESDAPRDGLDGVEAPCEVHPGDEGTRGLRRSDEPQRERRPAARRVAHESDARATRETSRADDGIERREPGRDDIVTAPRVAPRARSCRSPASLEGRESGGGGVTRGHRTPDYRTTVLSFKPRSVRRDGAERTLRSGYGSPTRTTPSPSAPSPSH